MNSKRDLIELMLGQQVAIKYLSGPDVTDENVNQVVEGGRILSGQLEARTATFYLRAYSNFGVEVTRESGTGNEIFLPWSAVLAIWGPSRESLERESSEARPNRTETSAPTQDRQELMDRLLQARTPSEIVKARDAADSWLSAHPSDGDVRLARERLRQAYPEEALEEGNPT